VTKFCERSKHEQRTGCRRGRRQRPSSSPRSAAASGAVSGHKENQEPRCESDSKGACVQESLQPRAQGRALIQKSITQAAAVRSFQQRRERHGDNNRNRQGRAKSRSNLVADDERVRVAREIARLPPHAACERHRQSENRARRRSRVSDQAGWGSATSEMRTQRERKRQQYRQMAYAKSTSAFE
jgi:hypothetical protein